MLSYTQVESISIRRKVMVTFKQKDTIVEIKTNTLYLIFRSFYETY